MTSIESMWWLVGLFVGLLIALFLLVVYSIFTVSAWQEEEAARWEHELQETKTRHAA